MRNKWKVLVVYLVMAVVIFLEPVSHVRADEGTYSSEIPYLQGIDVELERNDGWKVFDGILTGMVDKQRSIGFINFKFDNLSAVDYTKYELVFDFELKSLLDDGSIAVYQHQHVNDIDEDNSPGFFNNLLISLTIKDDFFTQNFSYPGILNQSPYYQEKVTGSGLAFIKGLNSYNTVISKVDCYLREKSTGNFGLKSRFTFTWDSDFWCQLCNSITYELVFPESGEILDSKNNSDVLFAGSLDSDGDDGFINNIPVLGDIYAFITDVPAAIIAFFTGFLGFVDVFKELILVVFPFLPGEFVNILILLFGFILVIGVYKLVQGWFG